ncbi:undecaprenyl-diphosphate phosphatase [Carboxylicivirga sp. M1479]|uniref:undecaprenyl-diphosphate phosphatase n=1 Tax=Carboxylicivirga sp. M1479 TaxID=2594476 RepID=UPI0011783517|nr:undecaprenyl-diphosphate phosphatase [Carboxylicivirga sp. M1479]TRX71728.1 undecaprenyl-diphosphate phosphatase [Carboxylicivirga sp. M1479]
MGIVEALILGIIQGLTEFLPVSSSGHLEIVKAIFGDNAMAKESMFMTVMLHGATAISTIVIFRKEIFEIISGLFQFKWNEQTIFSLKIIVSMVPAAVIGVLFNDQMEALFDSQILLVGCMLILTAGLLFLADKAKTTDKGVSFSNAVVIGIAQAIAILPGISRSGATISTSVLLGIDRTRATRFSFLMVVPLILGKMAKDLLSSEFTTADVSIMPVVVGFVAAFLTGLLACTWMIKLVKNSKLVYFSIYCAIVGTIAIVHQLWF